MVVVIKDLKIFIPGFPAFLVHNRTHNVPRKLQSLDLSFGPLAADRIRVTDKPPEDVIFEDREDRDG